MHPLRIIKRFLDKILGTKSDELFWEFRHFFDKDWAKSYISEGAINHPHRKLLVEKISKFYPFENVLEIGSASGANLFLLAKKYPQATFYGIDVSSRAIGEGKRFFSSKNIKNVFFKNASILNLDDFESKSMDVVFSDAALIYVGREKIDSVIKEMSRIAKRAIVLCEQHTERESFYDDKWVHNCRKLISKIAPNSKINFTKIPEDVWSGDWAKYGYIIDIILQ